MRSDDSGKVIVLPTGYDPEGDEAVVTRQQEPLGSCRHRAVTIDPDHARLVCRRCDEHVEPLDWIKALAADWQWYRTRVAMAEQRAKDAERNAERRVDEARRRARADSKIPMPLGKRLARIARAIGRAQGELAEAFSSLAEVHDTGRLGLTDHYLSSAEQHIGRARASVVKLARDHHRGDLSVADES